MSKLQATVRSAYITESQFAGLWKSVENIQDLDELTKQGMVCLLMISFRVGLRRGELLKLRICDVENSENWWLFVRNNRFGNNKSSSALRKIPLAIFLSQHEKEYFERYLNRRKVYVGADKKALLFSLLPTPHVPHDGNMLTSMVRYILKRMTGFDYTFHHLRHTAISRIYAVLEADEELISVLSPYSAEEAKKIRQAIHNVDDEGAVRDIYWSLSAFSGHASPETTFSNYIHFCDKALGSRLQKMTVSLSKVAIAQMTGLTANKLTRLCSKYSVSGDAISVQLLKDDLLEKIRPYSELIDNDRSRLVSINEEGASLDKGISVTIDRCHAVLRDAEKGMTVVELSLNHGIPEKVILQWVKNANYLRGLSTRTDRRRLFSANRKTGGIGELLVPPMPNSNAERRQSDKAIHALREIYQKNKDDMEWSIRYYFLNTHTSRSGIDFVGISSLSRFSSVFGQVFRLSQWRLYYYPLESSDFSAEWQQAAKGMIFEVQTRKVRALNEFPKGKGVLYLRHPEELELLEKDNQVRAKKYSSSAIRYIVHMLGIMLLKAG